jgi:hypothetical protein
MKTTASFDAGFVLQHPLSDELEQNCGAPVALVHAFPYAPKCPQVPDGQSLLTEHVVGQFAEQIPSGPASWPDDELAEASGEEPTSV